MAVVSSITVVVEGLLVVETLVVVLDGRLAVFTSAVVVVIAIVAGAAPSAVGVSLAIVSTVVVVG